MTIRSRPLNAPAVSSRYVPNIAATSSIVAHGRVTPSALRPGISPGRRRPSRGPRGVVVRARRPRARRRGWRGVPASRSIFGARLRTRWPQYGHSVTYGLTSDPQFLQTTKRSAPRAIALEFDDTGLRSRGRHDLGHDLAQVVVGLVDDDLARGAVAAGQEILDPVQRAVRAEVLGVLAQAIEEPARQLLGLDALAGRQVDELAVEAVPRGQPLVLVEHLPRVVGELEPG